MEALTLENVYICRKMKLYSYLVSNGFAPFAVRQDKYCHERVVWIFNNTDELQKAVSDYYLKMNY